MFATVSLLDDPTNAHIQGLWQRLEAECGLEGIKSFPIPHFTYQSAQSYDLDGLRRVLREVAQESKAFTLHAVGLGVFPGPLPVLYLSLVKTDGLLRFHQRVWDAVLPVSRQPNAHYAPGSWMPHISLALVDTSAERLGCAIRALAFEPVHIEVRVDNLAVVCQEGDEIGKLKASFEFADHTPPLEKSRGG